MRRISGRYIAGTELADAVRVVRDLNVRGRMATIDVLGEEVTSPEEARVFAKAYRDVLAAIERERLDANVSVKLTALGLELGYEHARANLEEIARDAAIRGNFVRIDMEHSAVKDDTLRLYRGLRHDGYENIGVVLQACLRDAIDDAHGLSNVRLCKGIYVEPPEIAFQDDDDVRDSFVAVLDRLLAEGAYVGIATHDDYLIEESLRLVRQHDRSREEYELQMLLGVREERADELVRAGHRLRIYAPFGQHWYAYSLRRLQENPKIAGYIAADTVGRLFSRRNGR